MKIVAVRTILLTGPSTNDPFLREARKRRSAAFIEILTDTELTGLGETYAGYFCPEMVPGIVAFFEPILLGCDVDDIHALWLRMYLCGNYWCRVGLAGAVLGGIEAALWDLKGKREGVPVYQLLGGRRHESLDCYATGGPSNYPLDRLAAKVDHYLSLGFRAAKIAVGSYSTETGFHVSSHPPQAAEFEAEKLHFLRERYGADLSVMLDGHMGNSHSAVWDLPVAIAVARAIEPFSPGFLEEPLPYDDPSAWAELARSTNIPIAGGECLTTVTEWRPYIAAGSFDIGQPDASFNGGLVQTMEIAAMLDKSGRAIATHSWGAAGSLMQNVHCGFAASNTRILEVAPDYAGLHSEILDGSFVMKDGRVLPPESPGLGIRLPADIRERYPFVPGSGEFVSVPGKVLVDP